jgi:hypothetical protein
LIYYLLLTEISSFCLIFKEYLKKNSHLYTINTIFFYVLFCKYRVISYVSIFRSDSQLYAIITNYVGENTIHHYICLGSYAGLYVLNLYWFAKINYVLYHKTLRPRSIEG